MKEDLELHALIKEALEADGAFVPRARPSALRWAIPSLLAASFAFVAIFQTTLSPRGNSVSEAIGLLSEADGVDLTASLAETPVELLRAWQEAPCAEWLSSAQTLDATL